MSSMEREHWESKEGWVAAVVGCAFNPSTQEAGRWISEFEASLVYRANSRIARTTQRNLF